MPIKIRATIVAFLILMLNLVGLTFGSLGGGVAVDLLRAASVDNPYTTMLVIFTAISALNILVITLQENCTTKIRKTRRSFCQLI